MKTAIITGLLSSFFWTGYVVAGEASSAPELGITEGSVTIDCAVKPNGRLKDCKVLKEVPEGHGYGEATIKLFLKNARADPEDKQVKVPEGMRRKFTYKWPIEQKPH